ncbi:hypothetical protein F5X98DRAFT_340792 [Xylaria grammica]|nr:hypothetical protein F5X98DRAFT_340792 [Xylaria grammica]
MRRHSRVDHCAIQTTSWDWERYHIVTNIEAHFTLDAKCEAGQKTGTVPGVSYTSVSYCRIYYLV